MKRLPLMTTSALIALAATPLVATITVINIYAVSNRVRQDTFIIYEPLLLLALVYVAIAGLLALIFRLLEQRLNRGMTG